MHTRTRADRHSLHELTIDIDIDADDVVFAFQSSHLARPRSRAFNVPICSGCLDTELSDGDSVIFISTLHGG